MIDTNCRKGVIQIKLKHKIGAEFDRKSKKCGSSLWNLPILPCPSMGVHPHPTPTVLHPNYQTLCKAAIAKIFKPAWHLLSLTWSNETLNTYFVVASIRPDFMLQPMITALLKFILFTDCFSCVFFFFIVGHILYFFTILRWKCDFIWTSSDTAKN